MLKLNLRYYDNETKKVVKKTLKAKDEEAFMPAGLVKSLTKILPAAINGENPDAEMIADAVSDVPEEIEATVIVTFDGQLTEYEAEHILDCVSIKDIAALYMNMIQAITGIFGINAEDIKEKLSSKEKKA